MQILCPHLQKDTFVGTIMSLQAEGYALFYIEAGGRIVYVAGYRFFTTLYASKMLYIDDLSTLAECRGKGYASMLLQRICQLAKETGCISVQLDSRSTRTPAHRLYYKEGFTISAFHFAKPLADRNGKIME